MKLRDVEFAFNALDADDMQRFEETAKALSEVKLPEGLSMVESIRRQCAELDRFFDGVLGEGAAGKLFTKAGDLGDRVECAAELSRAVLEEQKTATKALNKVARNRAK